MRLLALDTLDEWLSRGVRRRNGVAARASARDRRIRERAAAAACDEVLARGAARAARPRRHRVRRGPRLVHRRAHRVRRRAGARRWAPIFAVVPVSTLEALARPRGSRTARRASSRASTRACARCTSPPIAARAMRWAVEREPAVLQPDDVVACRTRELVRRGRRLRRLSRSRVAARARRRRRRRSCRRARAIVELAMPRVAAGDAVSAARRAAVVRAPSRGADRPPSAQPA